MATRTSMTNVDATLGLTGQRRHIAWTLACTVLVTGPMLVAALVAWIVAQLPLVDGVLLIGFTGLIGLMFAAIMARGSLWALQRTTSGRTNLVVALVVVTLATGILLGLLSIQALLPLGAIAVWAFATVPRHQA